MIASTGISSEIPPELKEKLWKQAHKEDRTMADIVVEAISKWLEASNVWGEDILIIDSVEVDPKKIKWESFPPKE